MGGLFGIGYYEPVTGGTTVGGGFVFQSFALHSPFAGTYGGTYGWILDTRIRAPQQTQYVPAPLIGLDSTGVPVVRGYAQMTWTYTTLRPDYWYYLLNVYNQSGRAPYGFQYMVLLQYPDLSGNNTPIQTLARMDPPTHAPRNVGAYTSVQLHFTYLGQAQLQPGTQITVLS